MKNKIKIGSQVVHSGHGKGTVIALNSNEGLSTGAEYALKNPLVAGQAISMISIDSFYPASIYPYVVKFEDGYQDVYAPTDITLDISH